MTGKWLVWLSGRVLGHIGTSTNGANIHIHILRDTNMDGPSLGVGVKSK